MEYTFTYNGVVTTVSDTKDNEYISFQDTVATNNTRVYRYRGITTDNATKRITIVFSNELVDTVTVAATNWRYSVGSEWYDYYYSIVPTIAIGTVTVRACINTLLGTLTSIYGEPLSCFSATHNHQFFHPIQASITEDGVLQVVIGNSIPGHTYQYSLDGITWQDVSVTQPIAAGTYVFTIKDVTESALRGFDVIKQITYVIEA